MQLKRVVPLLALLVLVGGTFVPSALAAPILAKLQWAPNPLTSGGTTTSTYGVDIDSDCPSGQTFSGTITVTTPSAGVSTHFQAAIACGSVTLHAVYPTDFTGAASTTQCGVYSAEWKGTTSALVGGFHPTFDLTNNIVVQGCTTAPEFGAPAMLVAAIGLVLVAAVKRRKLLNY